MASDSHLSVTLALVAVLAVAGGGLAAAGGVPGGTGAPPAPSDAVAPSAASASGPAPAADGTLDATATGVDPATDAGFADCTNGTSRSVLACGYDPGPTAVELAPQETGGDAVVVRAVNLSEGGFVAVHRRSFVDGNATGSLLGHTGHLDAGLHRDVRVPVDGLDASADLVAVAYRDDGDERFEFVASDGATDRPYTNTYSKSAGNVTDEAGDVIGDRARVSVTGAPVVVGDRPAGDPDGDGIFEDVDGNGRFDVMDVANFLKTFDRPAVRGDPGKFDVNDDGRVNVLDVAALLERL